MSADSGNPAWKRAPLLGHNLVRLLYLDEAGVHEDAPFLCVAGVIVHGDRDWPEIDRRIGRLIEKYIPAADRLGFVFHATDIFHGSDYFDRRKPEWSDRNLRNAILADLATIISDLSLPVMMGAYEKAGFGLGTLDWRTKPTDKSNLIHDFAVMDCLIWADRWLAKFAPSELATVIHEDGTSAKPFIKHSVGVLRSEARMDAEGLGNMRAAFNLPLRRIIDTVHFAEKPEARPLQLADLCAFLIGRGIKGHPVPANAFDIIWKQMQWVTDLGYALHSSGASMVSPAVDE